MRGPPSGEHGRRRPATPLALLAMLLLAGCAAPEEPAGTDGAALLASLQWPTLRVYTTPSEPLELTGAVQAAWAPGLFALWAEREVDLIPRTIVQGQAVFANRAAGMGWTQYALDDRSLSNRLQLWDLPKVLASPGMRIVAEPGGTNLTAEGQVVVRGRPLDVHVELGMRDGRVVWARQVAQQARESPFTFTADGTSFPFAVQLPTLVRPAGEVGTLSVQASLGHAQVIGLLEDYARARGGTLPDEPSPQSLQVELLASGKSWPPNPFTGEPLGVGTEPGDIGWKRCGLMDGAYTGHGWDGALLTQAFGRGCA